MMRDQQTRVPHSINVAKATDADILCLQEVQQEGDSLRQQLAMPLDEEGKTTIAGYDCVHWMPLHPKRQDVDPVGLAVAFRSSRFTLVQDAVQQIRRGMVVTLQMQMKDNGKETVLVVTIANVHLPARPAAVDGRLYGTIKAAQAVHQAQRQYSSHDGNTKLIGMICGDMNSDVTAPHLRYYLAQGRIGAGKYKDRNYVLRVTKTTAATLVGSRHSGFTHAYDSVVSSIDQTDIANITVSLHGRGPGRMDHIYYTNTLPSVMNTDDNVSSLFLPGRRSSRRQRSNNRRNASMVVPHKLRLSQPGVAASTSNDYGVQAVLATMDQNVTRTQLIQNSGLPNEANGFFSDHLPIGVMLGPMSAHQTETTITAAQSPQTVPPPVAPAAGRASPLSTAAQQRRVLYQASAIRRRRHNAVLRTLIQHLSSPMMGISQSPPAFLLCDVPLYKWPWKLKVRQKTRAPDLCTVVGGGDSGGDADDTSTKQTCCHIIVLEVTVVDAARQLDEAYQRKVNKYRDVVLALRDELSASSLLPMGLLPPTQTKEQIPNLQALDRPLVVALDGEGNMASQSREDLQTLLHLCGCISPNTILDQLLTELEAAVLSACPTPQ